MELSSSFLPQFSSITPSSYEVDALRLKGIMWLKENNEQFGSINPFQLVRQSSITASIIATKTTGPSYSYLLEQNITLSDKVITFTAVVETKDGRSCLMSETFKATSRSIQTNSSQS